MAVLQQMHDRYDGTWYTTLRFVQKTTRHLPDGKSAVTTWYETLQHTPERGTLLRIDVGAPSEGNGMLYSVDSVVRLRGGKVVARTGDGNPFLPLIEGVYVQPVSTTAQQIRALGIDLGKVYPREWNGAPVWVVGATSAADTTSAQMWVEPARMIVTRAIVPSGAGQPPLDIRLEGYEPAGTGVAGDARRDAGERKAGADGGVLGVEDGHAAAGGHVRSGAVDRGGALGDAVNGCGARCAVRTVSCPRASAATLFHGGHIATRTAPQNADRAVGEARSGAPRYSCAMSGPLLTTILQAIVGAAGLGGAVLLLAQARRRPSLAALAALLAVLGLQMVANVGDTAGWPLIGRVRPVLGMTYGPLLALFVLAISRHRRPLLARRWPHLLGPALGLLLVLAHAPTALVANAIFASLGAYLLAAHRILIRHRTVIALTRTDAESASLIWAERIIGLGFAVLLLNVSDFWIGYGTVTRWQPVSTVALYATLLVLVGVVSVRAVRYPESTGAISAEEEDTLPVAEATPFSADGIMRPGSSRRRSARCSPNAGCTWTRSSPSPAWHGDSAARRASSRPPSTSAPEPDSRSS